MEKIDELAIKWSIAKQKEDAARDERVSIEKQIIDLHPAKEEGSETFATPHGVKIQLTGKVTYKCDLEKLTELTATWPSDLRPIKTVVQADEGKLKAMRREVPELWAKVAAAITITPAKTGVSITFKE